MTGLAGLAVPPPVSIGLRIAKFVVPILLLLAVGLYIRSLTKERNALRDWRSDIIAVVKAEVPVDRRKTVTKKTAADEVRWLGREYRTAAGALRVQSERLWQAKRDANAAQNDASEARKRAKAGNADRDSTRRAIMAPGRQNGLTEAEWGKL